MVTIKKFVKKILLGNIIMPTEAQQTAANILAADAKKLKDDITAGSSQATIITDATYVYIRAQEAYQAAGGTDQTFISQTPDLTNNASTIAALNAANAAALNAANDANDANAAANEAQNAVDFYFGEGDLLAANAAVNDANAANAAANAANAANAAANAAVSAVTAAVEAAANDNAAANDAAANAAVNANQYASILGITIVPVSPSCFNEGTKILCLNKNLQEEYLPIETLRRGDFVKSYKHGYRRIELIGKNPMINDPERWHACMYKMEKSESNGLLEDLIVTGGHAVLVDELGEHKEKNDELFHGETPKIDDTHLLLAAVSKDFVKQENTNIYIYYHLTLENNGNNDERFGIWANGVLTETPSKNQFTAHKYTLL